MRSGARKVPIQLCLVHPTQEYGSARQSLPTALINDPEWHQKRRRFGDAGRATHHDRRQSVIAAKGFERRNSNAT